MSLSNNATPEELIAYAEELAGGDYGGPTHISYSNTTIMRSGSTKQPDIGGARKTVCGYVAYLLGVGLTNFPGCSEKDQYEPHEITPEKIQEFKKRTAYLLLQKMETVISEEHENAAAA